MRRALVSSSRLLVAALVVGAAVVVAGGSVPAGAVTRPPILVPVGQTVSFNGPAMSGNNYAMGRSAASCGGTRASCDTFRVTLGASVEELQAHDYMLVVVTRWAPTADPSVPEYGRLSDNQVNTYIYTDPPRKDDTGAEVDETDAFMVAQPTQLTVFKPLTPKFAITVENMYGINHGYTLEVQLLDVGSGPGTDQSQDEPVVDYSDDSNVAVTASFEDPVVGPSVSASGLSGSGGSVSSDFLAGPGLLSFDVLSPRADDQLDGIAGIDDQANFSLGAARSIARIRSGPPKATSASAFVLALWFLLLPALIAGSSTVFAIRRRRALVSLEKS